MTDSNTRNRYFVIVGMGSTGFSIACYLQKKGENFQFFDTRTPTIFREKFDSVFPDSIKHFVDIDESIIDGAEEIYLSPGVSRREPVIDRAIRNGKSVVGDIELFMRDIHKPVIGITGSNGKSTVTTLVGLAAEEAHISVAVGGNIGTPALDLIDQDVDLFVLELSSFQLESTINPKLKVACNLNVSEDHMDRYDDLKQYADAKRRIFQGAECVVYALDDPQTTPNIIPEQNRHGFGLRAQAHDHSVQKRFIYCHDDYCLQSSEHGRLLAKSDIKIKGMHNVSNALALFAIADAAGIPFSACKSVLESFPGLPHRCEIVDKYKGITYINDSKATNVGATAAAVEGLASDFGNILLIAGGDGKGANFADLALSINRYINTLILIGVDAKEIASVVSEQVTTFYASDMCEAVNIASQNAGEDDVVLLSPACASFDMYSSFEERGADFVRCVSQVKGAANAI